MSSSDRRTVLILLAAAGLSGCGFAPVHAPGGTGAALRGAIQPDAPADRLGFRFSTRIEDRLGRADAPRWALSYRIETRQTAVGVRSDNVITRYNVTGTLAWALRSVDSGEEVAGGSLANLASYSATGTPVATLAARRDAEDRLMVMLADQLVTHLYATAGAFGP